MARTKNDPRTTIGAKVKCKAKEVTSAPECKRIYGRHWAQIYVTGTIKALLSSNGLEIESPAKATHVSVEFEFPGEKTRVVTKSIRSVKPGIAEVHPNLIVPRVVNAGPPPTPDRESFLGGIEDLDTQLPSDFEDAPGPTIMPRDGVTPARSAARSATTQEDDEEQLGLDDDTLPSCVAEVNEVKWYTDHLGLAKTKINGRVRQINWGLCDPGGRIFSAGSDEQCLIPILDYFLAVFPDDQIRRCVTLTTAELRRRGKAVTTRGELLRFFGVMILVTRCEFSKRRELWSSQSLGRYLPAYSLGATGISKNRFQDLFECVRFSYQPVERPQTMCSQKYRWMLVDEFVDSFNRHRGRHYKPSEMICADESMIRWYGLGGDWINKGLPHYMKIDRKPENGCEIQNIADGRTGIMMQLRLVKGAEADAEELEAHGNDEHANLNHGTQVSFVLLFMI